MPKCFARVIARQWISLLAAAACKRIENPAARKIAPSLAKILVLRSSFAEPIKNFMTAATRLRLSGRSDLQRPSRTVAEYRL